MYAPLQGLLAQRLADIRASGLYKQERLIDSAQGSRVRLKDGRSALNLCANNYLGLANHPQVKAAAAAALERWGYGLGSVRFICGTQTIHRELEAAISDFLGTEDTILYSSCWDANGGLFETILGPEDAVLSDALNHASIIDGIRLCKAQRLRYANCDLNDLEAKLVEAKGARVKLIATDGVFSMDGTIAPLKEICDLADRHEGRRHDGRLPWRRLPRPERAAGPMSTAAAWVGWTSSPARWARRSAAPAAVTRPAARRSSTSCASRAAPTSSPTRSRR